MTQQKNKRFIFLWDIFISLLATYVAIEIPFGMIMHIPTPYLIVIVNRLVTVCFIIDIFIRFRIPEIQKGKSGHHSKVKQRRYPIGWFTIDVLAAIPFELFTIFAATTPVMGILRLLKMLKVLRIVSFRSAWAYRINSSPVIVRLSFFFYFLALCTHWISCLWFALRVPLNGISAAGLQLDMANEYVKALYWSVTTITTIGYGDITPDKSKNIEMIFTMFVQLLGAGAYGYIIGNIANMLTNIDMAKARHQERVDRMNSFMKSKKIPQKLQEQVYQYYNYLWETRKGYNDETILSELPESFKFEFAMLLNRSIIEKVPLFKGADPILVREVIFKLKPCIYIPGDTICAYGEIGDKMYFINKGTVEVVSQDGKQIYATLKEGDFFGEIALLLKQPRNATIRAVDFCDLYSLDKDSFDAVLSNYPAFEKHIKTMAHDRTGSLLNS
jgi:hypothetical protein